MLSFWIHTITTFRMEWNMDNNEDRSMQEINELIEDYEMHEAGDRPRRERRGEQAYAILRHRAQRRNKRKKMKHVLHQTSDVRHVHPIKRSRHTVKKRKERKKNCGSSYTPRYISKLKRQMEVSSSARVSIFYSLNNSALNFVLAFSCESCSVELPRAPQLLRYIHSMDKNKTRSRPINSENKLLEKLGTTYGMYREGICECHKCVDI
ncbi:unnamed protein product [Trichogramma brassicae]|uniref:Uncharacterized protein n=1 Tax=Trichogramma brassicae TaxID=86971 RepID=A0A6H5IY59_9HYME|nr:unnamed protein product [Trichogramma brassicae]